MGKTVPLWKAIKHMQEEGVVYAIMGSPYRYHPEHEFQYLHNGEWHNAKVVYKLLLDTDCVLLPHIDYHTGKPKIEHEPVVVDWDTAYQDMRDNGARFYIHGYDKNVIYSINENGEFVFCNVSFSDKTAIANEPVNYYLKCKLVKVEKNEEEKQPAPDHPQPIKLTPWAGCEMPVPEGTLILVQHRDGDIYLAKAGDCISDVNWVHSGSGFDIVGFAVIQIEGSE